MPIFTTVKSATSNDASKIGPALKTAGYPVAFDENRHHIYYKPVSTAANNNYITMHCEELSLAAGSTSGDTDTTINCSSGGTVHYLRNVTVDDHVVTTNRAALTIGKETSVSITKATTDGVANPTNGGFFSVVSGMSTGGTNGHSITYAVTKVNLPADTHAANHEFSVSTTSGKSTVSLSNTTAAGTGSDSFGIQQGGGISVSSTGKTVTIANNLSLSAGTGIEVTGNASGGYTITNKAPDVNHNTDNHCAKHSFSISSGTVTLSNTGSLGTGSSENASFSISTGVGISMTSTSSTITLANSGVTKVSGGTGISVTPHIGEVVVTNAHTEGTGIKIIDNKITNTCTVGASADSGISVAGSIDGGFWVSNTGVKKVTAGTGISVDKSTGDITISNLGVISANEGKGISIDKPNGAVTISNSGVTKVSAGTGISVSGNTGEVTISNAGITSINAGDGISITGSGTTVTITNTKPDSVRVEGPGNSTSGTLTISI